MTPALAPLRFQTPFKDLTWKQHLFVRPCTAFLLAVYWFLLLAVYWFLLLAAYWFSYWPRTGFLLAAYWFLIGRVLVSLIGRILVSNWPRQPLFARGK